MIDMNNFYVEVKLTYNGANYPFVVLILGPWIICHIFLSIIVFIIHFIQVMNYLVHHQLFHLDRTQLEECDC